MEVGESVSTSFTDDDDDCPLAPRSSTTGFTARKRPFEKKVSELRKAMKIGRSTRAWKSEGDTIIEAQNIDTALKQELRDFGEKPIKIGNDSYPLSVAAHHIIPGEASLPCSDIRYWLWADPDANGANQKIVSDVGYDVDGSENGVWLPTHQSMSAAMGTAQKIVMFGGKSWEALSAEAKKWEEMEKDQDAKAEAFQVFLPTYTQKAMDLVGGQFHDAHSNYNTWVTNRLNNIAKFFDIKVKNCKCNACKEEQGTWPKAPPYGIVERINAEASRIRLRLLGKPRRGWLTVYTSDFSRMYAASLNPQWAG